MSATFAFTVANGHVGENLPFQIVVTSQAHQISTPIILSHLHLTFEGGLREIDVEHEAGISCRPSSNKHVSFCEPTLQTVESNTLRGVCDLSLPPGSTKVFSLAALPLEAGKVSISQIILSVASEQFDFELITADAELLSQKHVWATDQHDLFKREVFSERSGTIEILPKPPKIRLGLPDVAKTYFTGESVFITIQIINEEEEDSNVTIKISLSDSGHSSPSLRWATMPDNPNQALKQDENGNLNVSLGRMASLETRTYRVKIQAKPETAESTLEVEARYFLLSEPETPITKSVSHDILFVRPLEANFNFVPQISDKAWPNFFEMDDRTATAETADVPKSKGPSQRWAITAAIASFASTDLIIESTNLELAATPIETTCAISSQSHPPNTALLPNAVIERTFVLDSQQWNIDDCGITHHDLQLHVIWRRDIANAHSSVIILDLPELAIPFGEPRVLASAQHCGTSSSAILLDYVLENPSMHCLSFSVTMDANEEFAFSGPKAKSVELVPYSHDVIHYVLLPLVQSTWIYPKVKIVDVHWNKILKVNASSGIKSDKKGIAIWIEAED